MSHVSNKAVDPKNIPGEAVGELGGALLDPPAVATDEVDVVGMLGQVKAGRPMVEVGMAHHLLGRRMSQPSHGVQDSLPLRRHPAPACPQLLAHVVHHPTLRSFRAAIPTLAGC
jgi:hypothetical protein